MTVHGAKGLEAPVVILPDTTARAKPQGPSLMPRSSRGDGEAWLMCPGSGKDDCEASADARAAAQRGPTTRHLRLLYVALTRARDRLIVMGRGLRSRRRALRTAAGGTSIAETFERLGERPRELATGDGRAALRRRSRSARRRRDQGRAVDRRRPRLGARRAAAPSRRARYVSPSQMEGAKRIAAPSPLAVASAGQGAALGRFRRGDLIHRLLERLPEIAAADRADAAARLLAGSATWPTPSAPR